MNRIRRPSELAINRTGIYVSPVDGPAVVEGAREAPSSPGSAQDLAAVRKQYTSEVNQVGHMPAPASLQVAVNAGAAVMRRPRVHILLDKLGERLAFERSSVRLVDALLAKLEVQGTWERGPTPEDLTQLRADEAHHFALLHDVLVGLGADPTAVTPSADLASVELAGVLQVVCDPRTTLAQALHAHLIAELIDAAAWDQLVALADDLGESALAYKLAGPQTDEQRHRELVLTWLKRHTDLVVAGSLKYSA